MADQRDYDEALRKRKQLQGLILIALVGAFGVEVILLEELGVFKRIGGIATAALILIEVAVLVLVGFIALRGKGSG